jgi:hypothetical protein
MYFCVDRYQKAYSGKTIVDAWERYEEEAGDFAFSELKFYKAEEIKVELKEVPFVKKVPVATKTITKKVSK